MNLIWEIEQLYVSCLTTLKIFQGFVEWIWGTWIGIRITKGITTSITKIIQEMKVDRENKLKSMQNNLNSYMLKLENQKVLLL